MLMRTAFLSIRFDSVLFDKGILRSKGFPSINRCVPLAAEAADGAVFAVYLFCMYSSIAAAAFLPAPIARITVAAPVTASPPA